MHPFGETRSAHHPDHLLQTPDTFVRAPLPGMRAVTAVVHAAPALGARFTQYTAEFESNGVLIAAADQRFVYVLEGSLHSAGITLTKGDYAWFPPASKYELVASTVTRAVVIEKPYIPLPAHHLPSFFHGTEANVQPIALMGDTALEVRSLFPAHAAFDLAVNTMTFAPGATLPMTEIHVMEHGLLMLEGAGIYKLGNHWYPVQAGDFIWMAPYLPQWFGALGKVPAKYLIYKDWNR